MKFTTNEFQYNARNVIKFQYSERFDLTTENTITDKLGLEMPLITSFTIN